MDIETFPTVTHLRNVDEAAVLDGLTSAFTDLAAGRAVQPPQTVTDLSGGADVIIYQGALPEAGVFGIKVSPYLPQPTGPALVTAWTLLMSSHTGMPLMLLDSKALTTERTAATTALAVRHLARPQSRRLAMIGFGPIGQAHLRYARHVREFEDVRIHARSGIRSDVTSSLGGVIVAGSIEEAVEGADVVMLCTSAAETVLDLDLIEAGTLVTSISTNAPSAREVDPVAFPNVDVYCDYRPATMSAAADFRMAADTVGFTADDIRGDLPGLLDGSAPGPRGDRPVYFRSVGLGIEDIVVARVAYASEQAG